jgi:hypothetical protein
VMATRALPDLYYCCRVAGNHAAHCWKVRYPYTFNVDIQCVSAWHDRKCAPAVAVAVATAVHSGSSIGPSLMFKSLET